ncbi:response regulator [Membranicola marinus]|uniref:Response regulator n=1 Tax=Membranihabitans marinus TaxID=1227546 RepID=A0A953LDK5_9BACT|nr:response regulator [Membranihabitans marinus]MBY5958979.1 response regulator [Membranihabitans marinus]
MKKILLIEDNEDVRENTSEILELSNYEVAVAENGKVGVKKALTFLPDLIICDIMMPELDGFGVLHAIQKNAELKNIPFIFLTAKTERSDLRKGMELGADDYLTKPFSGTELLNAVDGRLKKRALLKKELSSGMEGLQHLMKTSFGGSDLQTITEGRHTNTYQPHQLIYSAGNHPNQLYYVVRGKVKVSRINDDGKELVTGLYTSGDFFGYVAMLDGATYSASAAALEDTELATIPRDDFDQLIHQDQKIAQQFINLLAQMVAEKEEQLVNIAYNSLRRKVADALILLHHKFYSTSNDGEKSIDVSRGTLASVAGTAKESLIRTLSDFRAEALIEINQDRSITILDLKKLKGMIN